MAIKHLALPVKLVFRNKEQISPDVYEFSFALDKPLTWRAGQHGLLEIILPNGKTGRKPFSISSAPSEGIVSITTYANKTLGSPFKRGLLKLKKGSSAKLRGPIGPIYIKDPARHYALIATGIGITPFRAILQEQANQKAKTFITLFYVNNKDGHYYKEALSEYNKMLPNLTIKYIFKPERITGNTIEETLGLGLKETVFLLSGSTKIVKSYRRTLQGLGIPRKHIFSDPFYGFHPSKIPAIIKQSL